MFEFSERNAVGFTYFSSCDKNKYDFVIHCNKPQDGLHTKFKIYIRLLPSFMKIFVLNDMTNPFVFCLTSDAFKHFTCG
jgi:hypothetical protein